MTFQRYLALAAVSTVLLGAVALTWPRQALLPLPVPPWSAYTNQSPALRAELRTAQTAARRRPRDFDAVRSLAWLYEANHQFADARACFALLPADRLTARDHYALADLAINADGDLATAITELGTTVREAPQYLPARLRLAEAWFKTGELARAREAYDAVLAARADDLEAGLGLARIDLAEGRADAATARLENLLAKHPDATSAAALLAGLLQQKGQKERAIALTQWSKQRPEPIPADPWRFDLLRMSFDVQQLGLQAEQYIRTGQLAEADTLLARIEQIEPTSPVPALLRATAAMQKHDPGKAVPQYEASLAKGGDPEKIGPLMVEALLANGRVNEAEAFIAPFAQMHGGSVPILAAAASVALRRGDRDAARSRLTALLAQDPGLYAENMELARILWSAGDHDGAVVYLRQAAAADATEVPARALLAEYALGRHDPPAALSPLEQALRNATPGTAAHRELIAMITEAYLETAEAEAARGALADAIRHYDAAAKVAPNDARPWFGKANACLQQHDARGAIDALDQMARLDPGNPTVFLSLGDVLYQSGEASRARTAWSAALKRVKASDTELHSALAERLAGHITADTFK